MRLSPLVAALVLSTSALAATALAQPARAPHKPAAGGPTLTDLDAKNDPYIWLEDIEAPRSLAWVEGQNKISAAGLFRPARSRACG